MGKCTFLYRRIKSNAKVTLINGLFRKPLLLKGADDLKGKGIL